MSIPKWSLLSGPSSLSRHNAYWTLTGLGAVLAGTMLLDVYIDWMWKGKPLLAPLIENAVPIGLALTLVYVGRTVYQQDEEAIRLAEMAKWALTGCVGMILLSGPVLWLHVFPQEIQLGFFTVQLGSVGGIAGLWVGHHIAGFRQAIQKIKDERDRLKRLFTGLPSPVVHGAYEEGELTVLSVNPAFEKHFGYSAEKIEGQALYEVLVPEGNREEAAEIHRQALEQGDVDREVRRRTTDGPRDFRLRVARALNHDSAETYAVYTDITERRKREEELERTREQMELALEHTNSVLFGIDLQAESVWRRGAFEDLFGLEAEEVSSIDPFFERAIHSKDRGRLRQFYQSLAEGERTTGEIEYRTHPERGEIRWIRDHVHVEDAGSRQLTGLAQDITQQKDRQEELRRKERLYQAVFEDPNVLVGLYDTDGRILQINQPALEYIDASLDEIVGTPIWDAPWFEGNEEAQHQIRESVRRSSNGEYIEFEFDLSQSTGPPLIVDGTVRPVTNEEGEVTSLLISGRDITEQKRQEEELRRQKSLLEQAQRLAGAWEVDLLSGDLTWSEKIYEIHEVEPGTDVGVEDGIGFYAPEARPKIREAFERCIEAGEPYDLELPIITAEGNRRWVRTVGAPVEEKEGEIIKVAGAFQDISERKEKERLLERKNDLFSKAQELARIGGWEYDVQKDEGILTTMAYEIHGLPQGAEMSPETSIEFYHPDDRPTIREAFYRAIEEGESYDLELRLIGADDKKRWVRTMGEPQMESGEIVRVRGILQDITERKTREQRLQEAQRRMELALQHTGSVIFEINLETREVTRHGVFEDFFDASPEELPTWDVFAEHAAHPADRERFIEFYRRLEEGTQDSGTLEYRTSPETGEIRWIRDIVVVEEGHPRRLRGLAQDVTEEKERKQELVQAKEEAEEASRLKSAMLANMSHEIRTPLTSITGFSEVLKYELEGQPAEFIRRIHKSGERLMKTLDSVLQLAKLEAGVYEMEREEVSLRDVIDETTEMLRPVAERKSIALTADLPEAPLEGTWNEGALNRIAGNILDNAIKFTPEGGRITVRGWSEEETAVLEVEDTGVGIGEKALPEIFVAFKQESEGLDREYEGTGLGLSIVKELTEALGGEITVESEKGEGTCFTVRLPRAGDVEASSEEA